MKTYKILIPVALLFLAFSRIGDTITVSDKYKVIKDGVTIFEHSNAKKVLDSAKNTKSLFAESKVIVDQPNLEVVEATGGNIIAVITSESFELKKVMKIEKPYKSHFGNGCDSTTAPLLIVSEEPFDFKDQLMILNNCIWYPQKGLFNNGNAISVNEAVNLGLIVLNCSKSKVIN